MRSKFNFIYIFIVYLMILIIGLFGNKFNESLNIYSESINLLFPKYAGVNKSIPRNFCHLNINSKILQPFDICYLKSSGDKENFIGLYGDSNAWQYASAIGLENERNYDFEALTFGSCFFWNNYVATAIDFKGKCQNYIKDVIPNRLSIYRQNYDQVNIIISSDWWGHIYKSNIKKSDKDELILIKNSSEFKNYVQNDFYEIKENKNLIDKLIIIGPGPKTGFESIKCIENPKNSKCEFANQNFHLEGSREILNLLNLHPFTKISKEIILIDPMSIICNEDISGEIKCPLFINKNLIFSDGTHLSHWGAKLVISKVKENL